MSNVNHYPVPTNFFFARSDRILLSHETWNGTTEQLALAVGYAVAPGVDEIPEVDAVPEHEECTPIIVCVQDPADPENPEAQICNQEGETCETIAAVEAVPAVPAVPPRPYRTGYAPTFPDRDPGNGYATRLNNADSPVPPYDQYRNGPLPSDDPASVLRNEDFSCNALYNVKTWLIEGEIEGHSFSHIVPAGVTYSYGDGTLIGTPPAAPSRRTYLGTAIIGQSNPGADYIFYHIAIGVPIAGSGSSDYAPIEVMHAHPVPFVAEPELNITLRAILDGGESTGVTTAGSFYTRGFGVTPSPGDEDEDIRFLDRPCLTTDDPSSTARPATYSIAITAEDYWSPGEWYRLP